MKLRRKISLLVVGALAAATLALASASPALAAGRISSTGNCGDLLDMRVKNVGDDIDVGITIPSIDSTEVWSLSATEQLYGADSGGRHGNPINLTSSSALPPLVFNAAEGGFASSEAIANTDNATTGISYTATRTSPSPITCTNQGFWTNPFGSSFGPASQNPTGRPDSPPLFNTLSEADAGSNDVLLQFDQEMLDNGLGIPATNRFAVTVDGVARAVTAVAVVNDSPPDLAILA